MDVGIFFDLRNPPEWRTDWSRVYGFTLEMCEEAERPGTDSIWLSEHHLFDDGYLSIHQICGQRIVLGDDPGVASGFTYCRAEHEVDDRWVVMAICYVDDYAGSTASGCSAGARSATGLRGHQRAPAVRRLRQLEQRWTAARPP